MIITNDSGTQQTFEIARASSVGERGYYGTNGETPPGFYRGTTTEAKDDFDKGFRINLTAPGAGEEIGVAYAPDGTRRTWMQLHRNYQDEGTSLGCALFPTGDRERLKETITSMQGQDLANGFGNEIYVNIVPRDENGIANDVFDINGDNYDDNNNTELPREDQARDFDALGGRRRISPPVSTAPRHPIP